MQYILSNFIIIFFVCVCTLPCAASEIKTETQLYGLNRQVTIKTVCFDGKLFAIATGANGVGITQVFKENKTHLPPQPVPCRNKKTNSLKWSI